VLLQKRGLRLNPVTTLYFVAPCCLGFLTIPWAALEAPRMFAAGEPLALDPVVFVSNAMAACALNMSVSSRVFHGFGIICVRASRSGSGSCSEQAALGSCKPCAVMLCWPSW
jgi:hypothetical protein